MNWLRIVHETHYRYKRPVRFGPHRLLLRPREGHDLRVEEMRLEITPGFELEWSRDVFGNSVATVHLLTRSDELRFRSEVVLRQTDSFPLRSTRPATPVPYPIAFSEFESAVALAYQVTTFSEDLARVADWVHETCPIANLATAEEVVKVVGQAVRRSIRYQRREAKGVQSPGTTLSSGSGSCRDLATLMLEALRTLGIPARFASGYLDCAASEAGRAATHAWAEAYLPQIGWTGFDPTIGEPTSAKHVVLGVSNHPRGVMPISGSYFGDEDSYETMSVSVQTERLAHWSDASGSTREFSARQVTA